MLMTRRPRCPKDSQLSPNLSTGSMKMQPKSVANEFFKEHDMLILTFILEGQKVKNKEDVLEDYE